MESSKLVRFINNWLVVGDIIFEWIPLSFLFSWLFSISFSKVLIIFSMHWLYSKAATESVVFFTKKAIGKKQYVEMQKQIAHEHIKNVCDEEDY